MVGHMPLEASILARPHTKAFRGRLMVGRQVLALVIEVRILASEQFGVGVKIQAPEPGVMGGRYESLGSPGDQHLALDVNHRANPSPAAIVFLYEV